MKKSLKVKKNHIAQEVPVASMGLLYWLCVPVFLVASTLFFYYPSLRYAFQFDDIANITKHFDLRHYTFWDLFFSGPRWISYWLNSVQYALGKFDPYYYRLFNVCLHAANGVLLFFICLLGLATRKSVDFFKHNAVAVASVTALLFLLHPVQTQTVSYVIQGQLEGLAAFFMLSMTLIFMYFCYAHNKAFKQFSFCMLVFLTVLSCCTKEIAIISPVLLLLVDWFFIAQGSCQSIKTRVWVHLMIGVLVISVYTYFFKIAFFVDIFALKRIAHNNIGNIITHTTTAVITPHDYFISQFKVILHYFWIFLWPFSISVEYDWMLSKSFFAADSCLPFLLLCALAYGVIRALRRDASSMVAFGFCWFFICIIPRSSIIPSPELIVDYKTYMASCGLLFLLAAFIIFAWAKLAAFFMKLGLPTVRKNALEQVLVLSLVVPLGFATMHRNIVWRSGLEFWGNMLENAPGKARVNNNYGVELLQQCRKPQESIAYFTKAIALDPHYYDPYNNLAVAYMHTKQPRLAVQALYAGLRINPCCPEGYNNLASFLLQQGEYDQAESALYTALKLRPHYGKAHYNLGRIYFEQGNHEHAWQHFHDACMTCDLDDDMGFSAFAKLSLLLKKYDHAIAGYKKTLEILPDDQDSLFNLGNAYFFAQRPGEALSTYEHLLSLYPHDLRAWYNLGEVHFLNGQVAKALDCFKKVVNHQQEFPSYHIRAAQCYAQLGCYKVAYEELDSLKGQDLPDQITMMAQTVRQQIKKIERQYA